METSKMIEVLREQGDVFSLRVAKRLEELMESNSNTKLKYDEAHKELIYWRTSFYNSKYDEWVRHRNCSACAENNHCNIFYCWQDYRGEDFKCPPTTCVPLLMIEGIEKEIK